MYPSRVLRQHQIVICDSCVGRLYGYDNKHIAAHLTPYLHFRSSMHGRKEDSSVLYRFSLIIIFRLFFSFYMISEPIEIFNSTHFYFRSPLDKVIHGLIYPDVRNIHCSLHGHICLKGISSLIDFLCCLDELFSVLAIYLLLVVLWRENKKSRK